MQSKLALHTGEQRREQIPPHGFSAPEQLFCNHYCSPSAGAATAVVHYPKQEPWTGDSCDQRFNGHLPSPLNSLTPSPRCYGAGGRNN